MRTAVIGVGRMGRNHLTAIRNMGLEIGAVCDQSEEALSLTANTFSLESRQIYRNANTMLTEQKPELVVIATTAPSHSSLTIAAAEAGASYVLCEKPMAVSLSQCDLMIRTCQQRNTCLAINHYMRVIEVGQQLKKIVGDEAFGEFVSMTVSGSNFGLAMVGTHYLELFQYLVGEPISHITAWLEQDPLPNPRGLQFQDRAGALRATTVSGKSFYLNAPISQGHSAKVVLAGRYGQVILDPYIGTLYLSTRYTENRDQPTTRYVTPSQDTTIAITPIDTVVGTQAVLYALLNKGDFPRGETVRGVIAALVAAYVSDENNNQAIPVVDEHLPLDRAFLWA